MSDNTRAIIDRVTQWAAQQQLPAPAAVEHPEGDFDYAERGPRTGLPGLEIIHRPDNQR